ncbi:MAG: hypothetical protein PHD76_06535 [Methylacidiphilales bacterium]|nr:hypothetical protein [Candidatus Methylacidiphilales bacterium]
MPQISPFQVYATVLVIAVAISGLLAWVAASRLKAGKKTNVAPVSALDLEPIAAFRSIQNQISVVGSLQHGSTDFSSALDNLLLFLGECQTTMPNQSGELKDWRQKLQSCSASEEKLMLRFTELHAWVIAQIRHLQPG